MNNNIFSKVKNTICIESVVLGLLPQGKREGKHWVALNPTRDDNKIGSFKVNLSTGQFYDFATNDKGGDVISLYAYLNGTNQYKAAQYLLGHSRDSKNWNLTITPPKAPKAPKVSAKQYIFLTSIELFVVDCWSMRCQPSH